MKLICYSELQARYGITYCRVHLMRKVGCGEFPPPVAISSRRIAWVQSEVEEWLLGLTKKSR